MKYSHKNTKLKHITETDSAVPVNAISAGNAATYDPLISMKKSGKNKLKKFSDMFKRK